MKQIYSFKITDLNKIFDKIFKIKTKDCYSSKVPFYSTK